MDFNRLTYNPEITPRAKLHLGILATALAAYPAYLAQSAESLVEGSQRGTAASLILALGISHLKNGINETIEHLPPEAKLGDRTLAVVSKL